MIPKKASMNRLKGKRRDAPLQQVRFSGSRSRPDFGVNQGAGSRRPLWKPSEIAKAVVFLASDEATFTVGGELLIDGGMSL
jgi:NAD(P)-dependent dehydrogenase (short-subunit alcohol dehydrogenase family)